MVDSLQTCTLTNGSIYFRDPKLDPNLSPPFLPPPFALSLMNPSRSGT